MNPLLWRGPEFLLFYAFAASALLLWQWTRRQKRESAVAPASRKANLNDPYELAFLRGGKNELLRVATVALIEKKLLVLDESGKEPLIRTAAHANAKALNPVETYLLEYYQGQPAAAFRVLKGSANDPLRRAIDVYQGNLEAAGLLRSPAMKESATADALLTTAALFALAGTKIAIALSAGRRNIGFLIVFAMLAFVVSMIIAFAGRRTSAGTAAIEDMQNLCANLRRPREGMTPMEVAMLAAVFGVAAMPEAGYAYGPRLYPQASSSSSCGGSSCGSGGGDGGGGGCGGGGCGGCGGGGD